MAAVPTVLNIQIVNPPVQAKQSLGKRARVEDGVHISTLFRDYLFGLLTMHRIVQIDVSKPIPYPPTPEVVEALRQRILQVRSTSHSSHLSRAVRVYTK